jgi:hypothetical protein
MGLSGRCEGITSLVVSWDCDFGCKSCRGNDVRCDIVCVGASVCAMLNLRYAVICYLVMSVSAMLVDIGLLYTEVEPGDVSTLDSRLFA